MADFGSRNMGFFGGGSSGGSGTVTSVATTSPLTGGTITTSGTLGINQSSGSVDGYLSSTDWTTFNDKQTALVNPIVGVGVPNNLTYFDNSNSISSLNTVTYPSLTEISYVKGVTSAIQTQINNKPSNTEVVSGYQGLGSSVKAVPIGLNLLLNFATATQMVTGRFLLTPIYLSTTSTITGVRWFQAIIGNYTANNYNGVGLYSVSGGVATLIASSTNDGTIWQTFATGTWGNKAFSSPITNLVAGTYYIGALYNNSAQLTAPSLQTITSSSIIFQVFDFTAGKLNVTLASQLTLPSPLTLSTTTGAIATNWLSLY